MEQPSSTARRAKRGWPELLVIAMAADASLVGTDIGAPLEENPGACWQV